MGQYSSINFSSPAGADPLGIGVPDLGRSTYDPLATIRRGFDEMRQERMLEKQRGYMEYQKTLELLKPFEAINAKVGGMLNKELVDLANLAHEKYMAGEWSMITPKKGQESIDSEMSRRENEIMQKGARYNTLLAKYKNAEEVLADPKNRELIDQRLTARNLQNFYSADNLEDMERATAGGLVVYKPKPLEMSKWIADAIKTFAPDYKQYSQKIGIDPDTGNVVIQDVTEKEASSIRRAIEKRYKLSKTGGGDPRYASYIDEQYQAAPEYEKEKNGIKLTAGEWFADKYAPEYPTKTKTREQKVSGSEKKQQVAEAWKKILPEAEPEPVTVSVNTPMIVKTTTTEQPGKLGAWLGKEPKKVTKEEPQTKPMNYRFYGQVNLGGIFTKPFQGYVGDNSLDTETGTPATGSKFTVQKLGSIAFAQYYSGKEKDISIPVKDPQTGQEKEIVYHLVPNMPLPQEVADYLARQGEDLGYKPYLINPASYLKSAEEMDKMPYKEKEIAVMNYIGGFNKTLITPFEGQYKKSILDLLNGQGIDTAPLERYLQRMDEWFNPKEI